MKPIKILQIGLGPLGIKIHQYINEKQSFQTIAAVDINPALTGKDLGDLSELTPNQVLIQSSLASVENIDDVDVAILTTTSSFQKIADQVLSVVERGIPIVSTCEELTYPWQNDPSLAEKIDAFAKEKNVAVVSTGVNPGFLMDTLPSMLTGVCKEVEYISVNRFQDARTRRIPFQLKIGAGLTLSEFEEKKSKGTLRHVGLTESMQFIAKSVGWSLDKTEDIITPVIAEEDIETEAMFIPKSNAMGVRQVGRGFVNGEEKIKLVFEAAVGTGTSYDEVSIKGTPDINSRIEGGVHGDIATCSIVLNTIPNVLICQPGLKTMRDIPIVSYTA